MPPLNPSSPTSPSPPTIPSTTVAGGVVNNANNNGDVRKRRSDVATTVTPTATTAAATVSKRNKFNINGILHQKQLNRLGEVLAGPSRASKFHFFMLFILSFIDMAMMPLSCTVL